MDDATLFAKMEEGQEKLRAFFPVSKNRVVNCLTVRSDFVSVTHTQNPLSVWLLLEIRININMSIKME